MFYTSSANDATLKRTVAPADVFNALSELELDAFRPRLEKELEAFTEIKAGKRKVKKTDVNGNTTAAEKSTGAGEDDDVEMLDKPAKRVKRDKQQSRSAAKLETEAGGEETQGEEEEAEEDEENNEEEADEEDGEDEQDEEEEEEEDEDEEEDDDDARRADDDLDRVEDLDGSSRHMDPDADETDDEGPASQLRDGLELG